MDSNHHHTRFLPFVIQITMWVLICCSSGCRPPNQAVDESEIIVAAAGNLTDSFPEITQEFTRQTGIKVVLSFGSTADLAKQIENGAPFDVFAAADVAHVLNLEQKGLITSDTARRYARGSLVIWASDTTKFKLERLEDLTHENVERVAIAKPDVAPYGAAALETLRALNVWEKIEPKVVYGMNVSQVKQFVSSGNAEVGFLPLSLVQDDRGKYLEIDEKFHQPINQALGVVRASAKQGAARRFTEFVLGPEGQKILQNHGYRSAIQD